MNVPARLQEAGAGAQREARCGAVRAHEGDGPHAAAGRPAARGAGGRAGQDQGGGIFPQRPPLHLREGALMFSSRVILFVY